MCFYPHHMTHLTKGNFQNKRTFPSLITVQGYPPQGKQTEHLKMFKKN